MQITNSKYVVLEKKRGETPLETLEAWKAMHPELASVPTSYAGRLDPMAEGKLLVLLGDECKKQHLYTQLDKEYEIEIVLDVKTDSGDVLGLAEYKGVETESTRGAVRRALDAELGTHTRAYPIFSSKTVKGIPLFRYYFENRLDEITIPTHEETMHSITLLEESHVRMRDLRSRIVDALTIVPRSDEPSKALGADFRQDVIRAKWNDLFADMSDRSFTLLRIRVICGSGSYMRTLAERIGTSLGTTAFAISINRTKLGKYLRLGPLGIWTTEF